MIGTNTVQGYNNIFARATVQPITTPKVQEQESTKAALIPMTDLSEREKEVLQALVNGDGTNESIAAQLSISPATARTHICNIQTKTGYTNKTHMAIQALVSGVATLPKG